MHHHHFTEISSTQDFLKEKIETNNCELNTLVSCETQTNGKGQYDRSWDSFAETLCLSFVIEANQVPTLTSLEMACLVHQYFFEKYKIKLSLKWPNDIYTLSGKKVGGILLSHIKKKMLVGIGLNYFENLAPKNYTAKYGFIFDDSLGLDKCELNKKEESLSLFQFIIKNRLKPFIIRDYWSKNCIHLNKWVTLKDAQKEINALFIGIGEHGQALLKDDNSVVSQYYSGSLSI